MRSHSECGMMRGIKIEREKSLGASAIAVHRERDALDQEGKVGQFAPLLELRGRHGREPLEKFGVVRARLTGRQNISS